MMLEAKDFYIKEELNIKNDLIIYDLYYNFNINDNTNCYSYNIYDKLDNNIGYLKYKVISTMNEYKLCELYYFLDDKYFLLSTEILNSFLEYMILEQYCLKILVNVNDKYNKYINEFIKNKFVIEDNNNNFIKLKITKPIYLNK